MLADGQAKNVFGRREGNSVAKIAVRNRVQNCLREGGSLEDLHCDIVRNNGLFLQLELLEFSWLQCLDDSWGRKAGVSKLALQSLQFLSRRIKWNRIALTVASEVLDSSEDQRQRDGIRKPFLLHNQGTHNQESRGDVDPVDVLLCEGSV